MNVDEGEYIALNIVLGNAEWPVGSGIIRKRGRGFRNQGGEDSLSTLFGISLMLL